jgi:UDP-3-O-acyl-N-acetylglucosamine deacetylase
MNPFEQKPEKIEESFSDWKSLYPKPYDKSEVSPYTVLRVILMNGTEFESNWFGHAYTRNCLNNDIRRNLALVRRVEQQQQKRISNLKPLDENVLETTIGYEQLAVDLTSLLAMREPNPYVKQALDFALLEDFDHLYRYANLLDMEYGIKAENLVNKYVEIMPARPTISEHRFPYDDVRRYVNSVKEHPITNLNIAIITAAEQQTMNFYMNIGPAYTSDLGRRLYSEIAMIEEQHVTHYGSLMDTSVTMLKHWLMHEYTECYLYYSCYQDECNPKVKEVWERHLRQEISHLHLVKDMLKTYEGLEWQQVIPAGEFPEPLKLRSTVDYVREVIKTVRLTTDTEDYKYIKELSDDAAFFKYQDTVNKNVKNVPSHIVIDEYIAKNGSDYRYQTKEHPIKELQDRKKDNTSLGREKQA